MLFRSIGKSLALEVLARGEKVASTARDAARLDGKLQASDRTLPLSLDTGDSAQCAKAVADTLARFGRIDVLVNNAGHGMVGAVEEVSDAEVREVFDVNVFGLLDVTRPVLAAMRKAKSGHVINIGSVGGLVSQAGSGIYSATKFAIEGITEAMYFEMKPLGVKVTVVEPGPFRTDYSGRSLHEAKLVLDEYVATAGAWRSRLKKLHGTQPGSPDKAAKIIADIPDMPEPPFHIVIGPAAMSRATGKLLGMLQEIERWRPIATNTDYD